MIRPADPFAHLHVASGYSLRHGASHPDALVARAAELGQDLLALTDRDGVYGAVRFALACRSAGVRPILGVDLAVAGVLPASAAPGSAPGAPGSAPGAPGAAAGPRRSPARGGAFTDPHHPRVVLLARGARGWASLCRLLSAAHLDGERGDPCATLEQVRDHAEGLVALLGPQSEVGRALAGRRPDLADAAVVPWREMFGAALRVEVVSHLAPDARTVPGALDGGPVRGLPLSTPAAARMLGWARDRGITPVLANAVRHADRTGAPVVDVLDAIRRLVPLDSRHLDRANGEGHLKSGAQMAAVGAEVVSASGLAAGPEGERRLLRTLLDGTRALAESCALDPVTDLGLGGVHVPELDVLLSGRPPDPGLPPGPRDLAAEAVAADRVLRARCEAGLARRGYDRRDDLSRTARRRLEEELGTIATLGFAAYFLTVAEVTDLVRDMGVRVAARGSGAGSLVNHLLGISGVDPLRHGLLMERFLSPLRRALPDIDVDVESARRTEVYAAVLRRFGGERCTCVSMMDTYRVRHAVRDVGAALGLPPGEIDAVAKAFPHIRARDARAALRDLPELRASGLGRLSAAGELDGFWTLVEAMDGLPRHVALHPCGVLLSDATLLDRTPVEASWMGFPMSQFDKDDVEELGLLKLDVLGIRMQSAMAHAIDEIARVDGPAAVGAGPDGRVDVDAVPLEDPATFALIRSTHTLGCFQIESPGQRELVGKFAPETFDDLIIDISLFRPGPVKSDMVAPFLRARQGWNDAVYLHDDLRPALQETCGVVVFHEQVLRIVATMTGCSLAEADETRRSLGSPDGQDDVRAWFYPAALGRGYDLDTVERVWEVLRAFASFGFCKAHAAAFALPTYQSAWLKAHHPAAFLAGVLTHDPGMYPKRLILDDARNLGIAVLGLDVNCSAATYRIEKVAPWDEPPPEILGLVPRRAPDVPGLPDGRAYGIRLSLADVKGISDAEVARIVAGRPYASLADFWHRTGVSRPVAERLVVAGAFDALYGLGSSVPVRRRGQVTRRDLLLQVADLDRHSRALARGARGARGGRGGGAGRGAGTQDGGNVQSQSTFPPSCEPGAAAGATAVDRPADPAVAARRQSQAPAPVPAPEEIAVQLALDLGDAPDAIVPSGLPEMGPGERVRAELEVLGLDVSHHVVDFYVPMMEQLGVTRSRDLLRCRSRAPVLVAGVKVATQTPPVRSGRRVVFLTLDDGTGPIDATFFEDAQGPFAATLFHSWLLLVRGEVRRTGPRGISLRATGCWELGAVHASWQRGGPAAVDALLTAAPLVDPRAPTDEAVAGMAGSRATRPVMTPPPIGEPGTGTAGGMGQRRRVLVHTSGFRQSPYADVKPPGDDVTVIPPPPRRRNPADGDDSEGPPAKLWHSSPGSSGW